VLPIGTHGRATSIEMAGTGVEKVDHYESWYQLEYRDADNGRLQHTSLLIDSGSTTPHASFCRCGLHLLDLPFLLNKAYCWIGTSVFL
jgi:hypothetical protein